MDPYKKASPPWQSQLLKDLLDHNSVWRKAELEQNRLGKWWSEIQKPTLEESWGLVLFDNKGVGGITLSIVFQGSSVLENEHVISVKGVTQLPLELKEWQKWLLKSIYWIRKDKNPWNLHFDQKLSSLK